MIIVMIIVIIRNESEPGCVVVCGASQMLPLAKRYFYQSLNKYIWSWWSRQMMMNILSFVLTCFLWNQGHPREREKACNVSEFFCNRWWYWWHILIVGYLYWWICGKHYQTDEHISFLKIQYFRKVIVIFSVETAEVASSAMAEVFSTLYISSLTVVSTRPHDL